MIERILCDTTSDYNYSKLPKEKKQKYEKIYTEIQCCPEQYIIGLDVASPNSKDYSAVVKLNYEEWLKGNRVVENIEYF